MVGHWSMDRRRWEKIEEIFHSALELTASHRDQFIAKMCEGDADLHDEVMSLLPQHESRDSFLSAPILSVGLALVDEQRRELSPGKRVNGYIIKELIAQGGMGDVYLADDPRLDRSVALKMLQDSRLSGAAGVRRFEREARAASVVSHPNVAHIYDVGKIEGASYIAMEYVDGVSLRNLLRKEKLSTARAIDIARQVAGALAAAHAVGIVHRDIKPENIMLRNDRLVKVVDFGLAKMAATSLLKGSGSAGGDVQTSTGMIMGTVGYMSPEQVRGQQADGRSDIWSLGVVLYEMLVGERPFQGESSIDTLSSILKDEPKPSDDLNPLAERIVRRCLEKRPEDRFQSADDLAFTLASFGTASQPNIAINDRRTGQAADRRSHFLPFVLLAGITVALVGYLLYSNANAFFSRPTIDQARYTQVTFERGTVWSARFLPGGRSLIYAAAWNENQTDLFTLSPPNTTARSLAVPDTTLLSISAKGEMAVLKNEQYLYQFLHRGTLARMPVNGGATREIAENVQEADWAPDGENLAIVRWAGSVNKLEFPIGKVLHEVAGYLSYPRVSPAGDRIAFFEHSAQWDNRGDVAVVDLAGNRQIVSAGWNGLEGLAWHGQDIWFTGSKNGDAYALYSVTPGDNARLVANVPVNLMLHDISADGEVLLSRAIQQTDIYYTGGKIVDRDLSWLHLVGLSDLSADATTFLFTHFGEGSGSNYSVYQRKTDGSPAVRLGDGSSLALSPDKRFALARLSEPQRLILLPTKAGPTVSLPSGDVERFDKAGWFRDGDRIVFTGYEAGRPKRTFVQTVSTGEIRHLTPEGLVGTQLSPSEDLLVVRSEKGEKSIFSLQDRQATSIKGLQNGDEVVRWGEDDRTVLVYRPLELPIRIYRLDVSTGQRTLVREISPANKTGVFGDIYIFASPDASSIVYGLRRYLFDLYLVDGLK